MTYLFCLSIDNEELTDVRPTFGTNHFLHFHLGACLLEKTFGGSGVDELPWNFYYQHRLFFKVG
jgi:hypothetical protein